MRTRTSWDRNYLKCLGGTYLTPGMSFECDSWGFNDQGQSFVKKQTPATNWTMYMIEFAKAARGFDFETYKEGYGIKKIKILSLVEGMNDDVRAFDYVPSEEYRWGLAPRAKKR